MDYNQVQNHVVLYMRLYLKNTKAKTKQEKNQIVRHFQTKLLIVCYSRFPSLFAKNYNLGQTQEI